VTKNDEELIIQRWQNIEGCIEVDLTLSFLEVQLFIAGKTIAVGLPPPHAAR